MNPLADRIGGDGFALVPAELMRGYLAEYGSLSDWEVFAQSWNGMPRDNHMADGGRYRRRRHAVLYAAANTPGVERTAHRAHYQARDYNSLNGGVARMFAPVAQATTSSQSFSAIVSFARGLFDAVMPGQSWDIEMHQFRIEPCANQLGQPTPEGVHRDGVDYVLVLLIERVNIQCGMTTIHDQNRVAVGSFTLASPLDAALVHDRVVYHGVTAVQPLDPALPAHRDVLVLTFRSVTASTKLSHP